MNQQVNIWLESDRNRDLLGAAVLRGASCCPSGGEGGIRCSVVWVPVNPQLISGILIRAPSERARESVDERKGGEREGEKKRRNKERAELGRTSLPRLGLPRFLSSVTPRQGPQGPASPPANEISGPRVTWLTTLILNLPCRLVLSHSQPL